jgi:tetratricopeptide (TPR) repeat protein
MMTLFFSRYFALSLGLGLLAGLATAQQYTSPADRDAQARSAYARGDSSRAATALNEAVRLNPFDPVALNNLAVNYAATGDYLNAVALLERAQRLAPNRVDIINNLANLKAWMVQDSQFAAGTRGVPQALNFPRAEDTPPEVPPLWNAPAPVYQPPAYAPAVPARPLAATQAVAPVAVQAAPVTAPYAPPYVAPSMRTSAPLATKRRSQESASRTAQTSAVSQSSIITERASDYIPRTKKKPVPLDCPAP